MSGGSRPNRTRRRAILPQVTATRSPDDRYEYSPSRVSATRSCSPRASRTSRARRQPVSLNAIRGWSAYSPVRFPTSKSWPLLRHRPCLRQLARSKSDDGWDGQASERRVSDANNHDLVQFIGSLPRFVRRRIEDFPATDGYLKASPARVASWRARLSHAGSGLKVGIAWRGGKDRETQCKRSIPLEQWGPAFQTPGVRFFNLQHGPSAGEAALARNRFGVALDDGTDCDPLTDLDDFGAKIAALDLVISADNSTVHLAGALGRPVWTLLPFSSDWRWMLESESTPWYPTMRLLRCRSAGDWPDLMRRVGRLLATTTFGS